MTEVDNVLRRDQVLRLIVMINVGQAYIVATQVEPAGKEQQQSETQPPQFCARDDAWRRLVSFSHFGSSQLSIRIVSRCG